MANLSTNQVKFWRGTLSQYIDGVSQENLEGRSVNYNTNKYENAVYFAEDKHCLYVNGILYGIPKVQDEQGHDVEIILDNVFKGMTFVQPTPENPDMIPYLQVTHMDEHVSTIPLFKVTSANSAIKTEWVTDQGFRATFQISENDQVLSLDPSTASEHGGLKTNITIDYVPSSKTIRLLGKPGSGGTETVLGSIDATDFIRDGMIKEVSIVNVTQANLSDPESSASLAGLTRAGHYIYILWNTAAGEPGGGSDDDFYDDDLRSSTYINIEDLVSIYQGVGGAIQIQDYQVSLVVPNSDKYLTIVDSATASASVGTDNVLEQGLQSSAWLRKILELRSINGHNLAEGDNYNAGTVSPIWITAEDISLGLDFATYFNGLTQEQQAEFQISNWTQDASLSGILMQINRELKLVNSTGSALTDEVNRIETAVGLDGSGNIGDALKGTVYARPGTEDLENPGQIVYNPNDTITDAIENLDAEVVNLRGDVNDLDASIKDASVHEVVDGTRVIEGNVVTKTEQDNAKISVEKHWLSDVSLGNLTNNGTTLNTNISWDANVTLGSALDIIVEHLTWHINPAVSPEPTPSEP